MSARSVRTPEGDATFFRALEHGHSVRKACGAAGYSRSSVYEWREADAAFAAAWARAVAIAVDLLEEEADRRGRDGTEEPVFFQGEEVGAKRKYSDALLLARLKALKPQSYRERAEAAGAKQPHLTIVIGDATAGAHFARLVAERLADMPEVVRAHLANALPTAAGKPDTLPDSIPDRRPLSGLSGSDVAD